MIKTVGTLDAILLMTMMITVSSARPAAESSVQYGATASHATAGIPVLLRPAGARRKGNTSVPVVAAVSQAVRNKST
jgi:hypothetical protein